MYTGRGRRTRAMLIQRGQGVSHSVVSWSSVLEGSPIRQATAGQFLTLGHSSLEGTYKCINEKEAKEFAAQAGDSFPVTTEP